MVAVVIWVLGFIWVIEFLFWDLFGFEFLLWFELAAVPMGGAIGLLGSDRWLRERKRETGKRGIDLIQSAEVMYLEQDEGEYISQ